jgi:predicted amidohydrolase
MGKVQHNRQMLTDLVMAAAGQQAKIIVLPECAVQGYMSVPQNLAWSSSDEQENTLPVANVAEKIPGTSTRHFAALAKQLGVYIALPLIEEHDSVFYNSLVLLDPDGKLVAHHRKQALWPPGDGTWASAGSRPAQVVDTPYGRLGLMICYDLHEMPKQLKKSGADIVLYAVGWFGPNTENWYRDLFPRRYVVPNDFAVVAANWSAENKDAQFEGAGYSCVIDRNGVVLAMAKDTIGSEIVIADLPVNNSKSPGISEPTDE